MQSRPQSLRSMDCSVAPHLRRQAITLPLTLCCCDLSRHGSSWDGHAPK